MAKGPVLYFDRCIGTAIPEALRLLGMNNVYHHHINRAKIGLKPIGKQVSLFVHDTEDDEWLSFVAPRGWIILSQDYKLHLEPVTLSAIKQHNAKVFYLWGAESTKLATMHVFLNRLDAIQNHASSEAGPFVYRVLPRGSLEKVSID